jgi:hypothetical protein
VDTLYPRGTLACQVHRQKRVRLKVVDAPQGSRRPNLATLPDRLPVALREARPIFSRYCQWRRCLDNSF